VPSISQLKRHDERRSKDWHVEGREFDAVYVLLKTKELGQN
jgi:hypothetical protein